MKKKLIWCAWIFFVISSCKNHCDKIEYEKQRKIGAIIEKKQVLEWNHGEEILALENHFDNDKGIYLVGDRSGFFDYVKVGDSIHKESNSLLIKVYRENRFVEKFSLDFYNDCSN